MSFTTLISIEGVIKSDSGQVIQEGLALFHGLRTQMHIVFSSLEKREESVKRFFRECGIPGETFARLELARENETELETRTRHILSARANGYDLRYVVETDPEVARYCLNVGVTPLFCPHPLYARASFLPHSRDGGESWYEMEMALHEQAEIKAEDRRSGINDDPEVFDDDEIIEVP